MKPAVVLSGHTMALGVVRSLGRMGIPVVVVHYDPRDIAQVSKYVVESIAAPHPEHHEAQFIALLEDCAARYGGSFLVPASDESLVTVSKHKERLTHHYVVACPPWEVTRLFIEKKYTYALAEANDIAVPKTLVPKSLADVERYAATALFPCLVKPSQSHLFYERFKQKMFVAWSADALRSAYQEAAAAGLEVVLQEFIPGGDTLGANYNAYVWRGRPLVEFTAEKVRNAPPLYGSPRVARSQAIPEVLEAGRRLLQAADFSGYACTEFKRDPRDGTYKLMEVNPRYNLSLLLSTHCGLNFPWLEYRHLMLGELPEGASTYRTGVYWVDITRDIAYGIKHRRQERLSFGQHLRPYLGPHVFAIYDRRDLGPFVKRCAFLAKQAAGRVGALVRGLGRRAGGRGQHAPIPPGR